MQHAMVAMAVEMDYVVESQLCILRFKSTRGEDERIDTTMKSNGRVSKPGRRHKRAPIDMLSYTPMSRGQSMCYYKNLKIRGRQAMNTKVAQNHRDIQLNMPCCSLRCS